jgi:molybdopterin-guanine dinucleotide biosynthesis protein A
MGGDKAAVEVADKSMLEWVCAALAPTAGRILIVGRDTAPLGAEAVPDEGERYRGPLAGLVAAASRVPGATLLVVAVDQPWVRTGTLRRLADRATSLPVVPVDDHGVRQTTCAAYPASALSEIVDELEGGGSIQSLLDRVSFEPVVTAEWESWGEDGRSWFSADTRDDIERGLERYGLPGDHPPM